MHALKDNLKLINENEQAKKIAKDKDELITKLIKETEQAKELFKDHQKILIEKEQYFQKISKDAFQIKNLVEQIDQNRMLNNENQKFAQ